METSGINQLLGELRSTAQVASNKPTVKGAEASGGVDFAEVLKGALQDVSAAQQEARGMAQDFSAGDPNVNLQDVMVNLQKANLSFQQMVQVRNRLVTAYQDILNMPV
jgi:flagellar hook-basal body complex protein FliE